MTPSKRYSLLSSDLGDFFVRTLLALLLAVALAGCSVQPRLEGGVWSSDSDAIYAYYQQWQGTPYRLGGTDERGLDCSAFVQNLFSEVYAQPLARTTLAQSEQGYRVLPGQLEPGDLIFFKTGWKARHVGVYIGSNQFVHASTSLGVTRSSLSSDYWRDAFWQARRVR